jgi:hypothetical protein
MWTSCLLYNHQEQHSLHGREGISVFLQGWVETRTVFVGFRFVLNNLSIMETVLVSNEFTGYYCDIPHSSGVTTIPSLFVLMLLLFPIYCCVLARGEDGCYFSASTQKEVFVHGLATSHDVGNRRIRMTAVIAQDEKLLMDYYEKPEIVPEKRNTGMMSKRPATK